MALTHVTNGQRSDAAQVNQIVDLLTGVDTATPVVMATDVTVKDLLLIGKTGATAGGGLGGVTASGAPASGAHVLGELVWDHAGTAYICTAAGTPGTWATLGGGGAATVHADVTVGSGGADGVTLSAIPPGKVAFLHYLLRGDTAGIATIAALFVNGDNDPGNSDYYAYDGFWGGSAGPTSHARIAKVPAADDPAGVFTAGHLIIPGYATAGTAKTMQEAWGVLNSSVGDVASYYGGAGTVVWMVTDPLTSLTIISLDSTFFGGSGVKWAEGSRFVLWSLN